MDDTEDEDQVAVNTSQFAHVVIPDEGIEVNQQVVYSIHNVYSPIRIRKGTGKNPGNRAPTDASANRRKTGGFIRQFYAMASAS